jgi:hypothetical protein
MIPLNILWTSIHDGGAKSEPDDGKKIITL